MWSISIIYHAKCPYCRFESNYTLFSKVIRVISEDKEIMVEDGAVGGLRMWACPDCYTRLKAKEKRLVDMFEAANNTIDQYDAAAIVLAKMRENR